MRKIVAHDEDEAAMCVTGGELSDGMVVEGDVVQFLYMLRGDDARGAAFGHAGRMGGPDAKVTGMAILVCEVELNEAIPINANVDAFAVDGGAKPGVAVRNEGKTEGFQADASIRVEKAKFGRRRGQLSVVGRE
jgi:hypothetical protein